mmetsp:Transcript_22948/g.74829  ORF Transcript_22948/g.74829 Transcript_22948/m.74829 type:complete len:100 (-) Transcript_22948:94-393(-)
MSYLVLLLRIDIKQCCFFIIKTTPRTLDALVQARKDSCALISLHAIGNEHCMFRSPAAPGILQAQLATAAATSNETVGDFDGRGRGPFQEVPPSPTIFF